MKKLSRLLQYLKFYFEPKEKTIQAEAFEAARNYYAGKPVRSAQNPYPHPSEYNFRREEFVAFQQAYKNNYRHAYAKSKLGK